MCSLHIRADKAVQVGNVNSRQRNHTIPLKPRPLVSVR